VWSIVVTALVFINEVAKRRARLVLGWVTVYGKMNHFAIITIIIIIIIKEIYIQ